MIRALALAAALLVSLAATAGPSSRGSAQEGRRFTLIVHADRVDEAWLEGQLANAGALFAPAGVSFALERRARARRWARSRIARRGTRSATAS